MMIDDLREFFIEIKSSAEAFGSKCYDEVLKTFTKKISSKGPIFNVRPYEYQRAGFEKGKELERLPKSTKGVYNYYLDSYGKVLLIENYGQKESIINREYFLYEDDAIRSIYFNNKISLRNVTYSKVSDGLVIDDINYGKFGESTSLYEYKEKVLVKINVSQKEHLQQEYSNYIVDFKYNDGDLVKITHHFPNGYTEQRYP